MVNQRLKTFWENKIDTAITTYSLDPSLLTEGTDWKNKLNALSKWKELDAYGKTVFSDVLTKAKQVVPNPLLPNSDRYGYLVGNAFEDLENEFADLVEVMKTKIGVDPTDDTLVNDVDGHPVPKWKNDINKRIYNQHSKLTDIPDNLDLADLIYEHKLYKEIVGPAGLENLISENLTGADRVFYLNENWLYKVNKTALQGYKDLADDLDIQKAFYDTLIQALDYNPTADDLDATDPWKDLKATLDGQSLTQIITERDGFITDIKHAIHCPTNLAIPTNWQNAFHNFFEYCRTDLGIADPTSPPTIPTGEDLASLIARPTQSQLDTLQTWKDTHDCLAGHTCPDCNLAKHNDYDTLKQERDQLKTDQTTQEQAKQQAIQAKETEIINKIITDLGLTTERENVLEAVITEIKNKITPPTDNSADKQKISELEAKITNLQAPKSLNDVKVSSEVKKEITKLSQDLGISNQTFAEELKSVNSYQQLANLQNKVFKEELNKETDSKNSAITLNYCLGALSLGSLLVLAWMLIKQTKTDLPKVGEGK